MNERTRVPRTDERFAAVEAAIAATAAGRMVVMVDDEDRENEGDLVIAAEHCSPAAINFMCKEGRGLVCLALSSERVDELGLPMMVPTDPGSMGTAFTVSIEAKRGVTTGISAADRAETIRVAIDRRNGPEAIVSPGHVFPLRARPGGVLVRSGHTEGSLDLSRLAGCTPAAVICEIMRDDGEMARMDDLEAFADRHQLPIVTIADLIEWRLQSELLVEEVASQTFSSQLLGVDASHGFSLRSFRSTTEPATRFVALCKGKLDGNAPVLLRAQRSYMLGDVFGLVRPDGSDTGSLLRRAIAKIDAAGCGAILYVLTDEVDGGVLGLDSEPLGGLRPRETGFREFGLGAQVLKKLGVAQIRVLTDNPRKIVGLEGFGIEVVGSEPLGGK